MLTVAVPATIPEQPSAPNQPLMILLGLMLGLVGGLGLAFVSENLDTKLYTTEQMEASSGLPILGEVPQHRQPIEIEFLSYVRTDLTVAFANLAIVLSQTAPRTLLITSAEPGEGKSTIASNLAVAIAQLGHKVVLVDGDLRLPVIHSVFALPNSTGLSAVLRCRANLSDALQTGIIPGLKVLTSGPLPDNPATLLSLPEMVILIDQLRDQYDIVLFDTPALLPVPDATRLAPFMDGVIIVARRGHVRQETVHAALQKLTSVNAHFVGLVVNGATSYRNFQRYYRRVTISTDA
jgi:capsular exopolysaccharide synthesis family protein